MKKAKESSNKISYTPDEKHRRSYLAMLARLIAADIERQSEIANEALEKKIL